MKTTHHFRSGWLYAALGCGLLAACGGDDEGGSTPPPVVIPPPTQPQPPSPPGPIIIQPTGTPRIILSHGATISHLRSSLTSNSSPALRFRQSVDQQVASGNVYGMEPWHVALMGQITGTTSYCSWAVDQTDNYVRGEEARITAGTTPVVAGDSYLHVGDYIGNLSMVYDWCRSSMTAAQRERWKNFGNQAVWNVWNHASAQWGSRVVPWTGWSVDNPSNNYYYSFLEATMLLGLATHGENDMANDWLTRFRQTKIENQLVPLFNADLVGGGSREGTGYGTAMFKLWRIYDWWERSTGERIADRTPHTLASMPWMIHAIVPTLDRIQTSGDHSRDQQGLLFDYHRAYLQNLAFLFPNERVSGVVKSLLRQSSVPQMSQQFMRYSDYFYDLVSIADRPLSELSTAYWASGTGSFSMRDNWLTSSAYANFMCGPYTESHAHQDQGSFVLFKGSWLAYDANIDGRSGIEQDQKYHNLVRFEAGGAQVRQSYDKSCNMLALAHNATWTYALADVTPMFASGSPVAKSEREFVFIKPSTVIVYDRAQATGASVDRIWTMNFPRTPSFQGNTTTFVASTNRFDMTRLAPAAAIPTVTLWSNANPEQYGARGNAPASTSARVDWRDSGGDGRTEFLHVIGLDGSVSQAVRSDASGQTGTRVTLSDGRAVTVRFNISGRGGTIEIRDAFGAVQQSGNLPATIQAPPIYSN